MKKKIDGLCSLQEYKQMRDRIYDAISEWLNYYDADSTFGLVINPQTHEVGIDTVDNVNKPCEWYACEPLIADGEADASAILDLTDQFCFVR